MARLRTWLERVLGNVMATSPEGMRYAMTVEEFDRNAQTLIELRTEAMRRAAQRVLEQVAAGRHVDAHSLEWALAIEQRFTQPREMQS